MTKSTRHWTANSTANFAYSIAADFAAQVELKLEGIPLDRKEYAKKLGVGKSRVSKLLNDPGNLSVESMVRCARALGMKVAVVAYDDNDPNNENGPIGGEVFRTSWEKSGQPRDMFDFASPVQFVGQAVALGPNWGFYRPPQETSVPFVASHAKEQVSNAAITRSVEIGQSAYAA